MGVQAAGDRMVSGQPLILAGGCRPGGGIGSRGSPPIALLRRASPRRRSSAGGPNEKGKADWMDSWWHLGDTPYIFNER